MATEQGEKKIRTERKNEDYKVLSDRDQILFAPDMYVGSIDPEPRKEVLLNIETKKLVSTDIDISKAIERLFLEILSNAGDNMDASRRANVNPGGIDITMDQHWIRIRNGGLPIPVEHSVSVPDKLIPELIFGQLRSSTNYDAGTLRLGAGRNGLGSKLTNIFSKVFMVTIGDNKNKRLYKGMWQNNMSEGPFSEITEYTESEGFVEVCWNLDFERFGLTSYSNEAVALFARYAADFSLTCKVPITFNGISLDYRNIRDYATLHFTEEECTKALLHHEWNGFTKELPNGVCPMGNNKSAETREKMIAAAVKAEHIPVMEIMILDTPDAGVTFSFVNGLMTIHGGKHVDAVFASLSSQVIDVVNKFMEKSKKKEEGKNIKLNSDDVKRHISMIINCRIPDPKYTSQSKTELASPKPHVAIPEKLIKNVENWSLISRLYAALEAKMFNVLKKTNGGRVKHIDLDAGEDANFAGTEKSSECILYLVEGKSASAYPKKRIDHTPGKKNTSGYYPLRGKFMNVRNANVLKVAENKEVAAIKTMIGLREGQDYSKSENILTLRYGYIMICVDADSDGFHIASLLINYIDRYFPGLLYMGRVGILRTPVVRIYEKDKILHRFYSVSEFEKWQKTEEANNKSLKIIYYKGLGKSSEKEIIDDLTTAPVVTVVFDEQAASSLTLAFDKSMADSRKEWIAKWREVSGVDDITFEGTGIYRTQKITNFINHELIDYTKDALFRAIPSQDDGLKRSHRQALYAALKFFKYGRKKDEPNVARFAAYAATETNYHHGETSMCDTIIKMAQDYTGSNNLPFFNGIGQFGTRSVVGEDACSPRYLHVNLPEYAPLLYDEELIDSIPKRMIDGDEVEPLYVPGVVPMHLINGVIGIATGYSTYIPSYNYYDIINWCKNRCVNKNLNNGYIMKPWFRGFSGTVEFSNITEEEKNDLEMGKMPGSPKETVEGEEEEDETKAYKGKGLGIRVRGIYKERVDKNKNKTDIMITELPVGMGIVPYKNWLKSLVKEKIITDFIDNSTSEVPSFEIFGYNKGLGAVNYKNLKLDRTFTLSNLVMIDQNGYPTRFTNTNEILEIYSQKMIGLYGVVKQNRLEAIRSKIEDLSFRIQFINCVRQNVIILTNTSKKSVLEKMSQQNPPIPDKYINVKAYEFTDDETKNLSSQITQLQEDFKKTLELLPEQLWLEKLSSLESYLRKHKY